MQVRALHPNITVSVYVGGMTPSTLAGLENLAPGPNRVRAAEAFIARREHEIKAARKIRDDDVRALAAEHGPSKAAELTGLTVANVRAIRGRP